MASKKTRTARPAKQDGLIKATPKPIADPVLILTARIAQLQHDLDALRIRLDALEASRLAYAPAQQPQWPPFPQSPWWCFWKSTSERD